MKLSQKLKKKFLSIVLLQIGVNIAYNSEQGHVIYLNECEYLYERESFNVNKKIVLKNALFELDTLIYPTITAMFYIHRIAKHYTVNAKLAVFFFKMELWDLINYEVSSLWKKQYIKFVI